MTSPKHIEEIAARFLAREDRGIDTEERERWLAQSTAHRIAYLRLKEAWQQADRLVALKHWAAPIKLDEHRLTAHVLEGVDPAAAILEFAQANSIDHILIGARQNSLLRKLLGSVSAKVAAEALCTVTVVRSHPTAGEEQKPPTAEDIGRSSNG